MMSQPLWQRPDIIDWSQRLLASYRHWLGQDLLPLAAAAPEAARQLFWAPRVVVSHGTQADPVLNYGNQAALDLWQLNWDRFTQTPSRHTAEPMHRQERTNMLAQLEAQGYVDNYRGVRISSQGRRFYIERAIIWNVVDDTGKRVGQAATFKEWQFLS
ncbi:hypothetical protein XM38_016810 [Halomicronema hongdechloris C2206]|uniref:MEKHLA domain-containing protein n=1 Tax=Halomicronema hongdechloris C2206 TaxID=1641165 RepID=A0A1Z3HKF0_9CYAN|nr:MEKHLA domain-containing protein [Halomicronema hongdechloris]ASC70736.1 hypothetical protein XM38_016810 [Halomicronema hongdechloris C2206]